MSAQENQPQASLSSDCTASSMQPVAQTLPAHEVVLGEGMHIYRALPTRLRRTIGAWCFLDHFGPLDVSNNRGLRVGPHPHIGLQTVTWLLQGEVLHRDSLGSLQSIEPGALNIMTAGRGISHSEESPLPRAAQLQGAQLWIALPQSARETSPAFAHHAELPVVHHEGLQITVLIGETLGKRSPAKVYSPLVGMQLRTEGAASSSLPVDPRFEYGAMVLEGSATIEGVVLAPHALLYLGCGRDHLQLSTTTNACVLLLGGEPLAEPILMWWNFVARTQSEIVTACCDWNAGADYFGEVHGYDGERLLAPMPPWASAFNASA